VIAGTPIVSEKADSAFTHLRRRAFFQRVLGFFTRHAPGGLLSFDEVRDKLQIRGQHYSGLQTIPLEQIVGTVGRYREFNRAFLPTREHIRARWKRVYQAAHEQGFPPIEVYRVGEVYFVRDGHHRVSVLKELGATTVEAYVTEFETPVPLSPTTDAEELDLKREYANFLRETGLAKLRPSQRVEFTLPGQYPKLQEHIAVHRHFLGLAAQREIPYQESVARWYDEVYMPVVHIIRQAGILDDFPRHTEADLYLWLIEHRHYLSEQYGQDVPLEQAAAEFTEEFSRGAARKRLEAETTRATSARDEVG
jgi:hypothetical protein